MRFIYNSTDKVFVKENTVLRNEVKKVYKRLQKDTLTKSDIEYFYMTYAKEATKGTISFSNVIKRKEWSNHSKSYYKKLAQIEIEKQGLLKFLENSGFVLKKERASSKIKKVIMNKWFQNIFSASLSAITIPHSLLIEYLPAYKISNFFDEKFFNDMLEKDFETAYMNLIKRNPKSSEFLPQYEKIRPPLMMAATIILLYTIAPDIWDEHLKHHFIDPSDIESAQGLKKIQNTLSALSSQLDYNEHSPKHLLITWISLNDQENITTQEAQSVLTSICLQLAKAGENWSRESCTL